VQIVDLGVTDYKDAYRLQMELLEKVSRGLSENTLLITEHRPVITIGRKGSWANIFKSRESLYSRGIEVLETDRGGGVTYHGPGQIVAYPVFKLENEARDIHSFLEFLEKIGSHFLMQYGLSAEPRPGLRGVWVKGKKIASIGIGVKRWVTYHGLAININTDLAPFSFIRPCGIEGVEMTSLKTILGRRLYINDAKDKLKSSFEKVSLLAAAVRKD